MSCTHVTKQESHLTIHKIKKFTQLKYKCPCLLCSCSRCVQRGHKCIRQAVHNASQPYPLLSHQIHRISRGTPPWTACPLGLPSARLCIHHHQSQRGGPPFLGQGTQQHQDGHPWHTSERHCVLSALDNRNSLTTDHHLCTHAYRRTKEIDNSRCEVVHVVHVTIRYIVCALLQNTSTHCVESHGISHTTKSHITQHTIDSSMNRPAQWSITLWHCTYQLCGNMCKGWEVTLY